MVRFIGDVVIGVLEICAVDDVNEVLTPSGVQQVLIHSAAGVLDSGAFRAGFVPVEPNPAAEGLSANALKRPLLLQQSTVFRICIVIMVTGNRM